MSDTERNTLISEGRCFYCREPGHISLQCPKKVKATPTLTTTAKPLERRCLSLPNTATSNSNARPSFSARSPRDSRPMHRPTLSGRGTSVGSVASTDSDITELPFIQSAIRDITQHTAGSRKGAVTLSGCLRSNSLWRVSTLGSGPQPSAPRRCACTAYCVSPSMILMPSGDIAPLVVLKM
jgi:hypothetical protein